MYVLRCAKAGSPAILDSWHEMATLVFFSLSVFFLFGEDATQSAVRVTGRFKGFSVKFASDLFHRYQSCLLVNLKL